MKRYPGARSDTESFIYCFSFDKQLLQDWSWKEKYLRQPEILSYVNHVVERYDLAKDYDFNTELESFVWDDSASCWVLTSGDGKVMRARYVITAVGLLSKINYPNIPGRETFAGAQYHTGAYPEGVDLTGKRVGLIGTGSTGVQIVSEIGSIVGELTVFQRRYVILIDRRHL